MRTVLALSAATLMLAAAIASPALAPAEEPVPVDTKNATTCDGGAFSTDPDPRGTNVRAAPRADARVIGWLPPRHYLSRDDFTGIDFQVVGSKDGWLLIQHARLDEPVEGREFAFEGQGWIWGGLASLTVADERLFAAPREDAKITVWLMEDGRGWGGDSFEVTRIHGCEGKFAEISATPRGEKTARSRRGWVIHYCTAQLTTCDYGYPADVHRPVDYKYPG